MLGEVLPVVESPSTIHTLWLLFCIVPLILFLHSRVNLQAMRFFSYAQGKAFMAPLTGVTGAPLTGVTSVTAGGTSKPGLQVVTGWGEGPGHPGFITAVLQQVGNPLILMVEPEKNTVQEIKVGAKAKIMDMVAIRHLASGSTQTTQTT